MKAVTQEEALEVLRKYIESCPSLAVAASSLGIHRSYLSRLLRGEYKITKSVASKLNLSLKEDEKNKGIFLVDL